MGNFEITSNWWKQYYTGKPGKEYAPDTVHEKIWANEILSHFAPDPNLKILDVGTGGGYFARLLSAEGHEVIGIDANENAIKTARMRAERDGVNPEFRVMDNHALDFPDDTFDLVVSRNVVWTLYDPAAAYLEWKRVLKPGGKVIVYDANWHLEFYHPEIAAWVRSNEQTCKERYGVDMRVCTDDKAFYDTLPLSDVPRPAWDRQTLVQLGFTDIEIRSDISAEVYTEWERCLYAATPFFEICAVKPELEEKKQFVRSYWNQAEDEKIYPDEALEKWAEIYGQYLPDGKSLDILDVGTGGGFVACALAKAGHRVTGVDLSDQRIRSAKKNAAAIGLDVRYLCTDAGELPFPDGTFDVVVCRNLVWTLYQPEETFAQWKRVLKPGGLILYVDANWYYYLYDEASRAKFDPVLYPYSQSEENRACENSAWGMPLSSQKRPEWDCEALVRQGMTEVESLELSSTARTPEEQRVYAFAPLFAVRAKKPENDPA